MAQFLNRRYGLRYILAVLDGVAVELCGYAMINLFSKGETLSHHLGLGLGLGILAFYVFALVCLVRMASQFSKNYSELAKQRGLWKVVPATKLEALELREEQAALSSEVEKLINYPLFFFTTEEYKPDLPLVFRLTPAVYLLRCLLLPLVAYPLADAVVAQNFAILFLELSYFAWIAVARPKQNPVDNLCDCWLIFLNVLYIFVRTCTNWMSDQQYIQYNIGLTLTVFLLLMICTTIIYVILMACYHLHCFFFAKKLKVQATDEPREKLGQAAKEMSLDDSVVQPIKGGALPKSVKTPRGELSAPFSNIAMAEVQKSPIVKEPEGIRVVGVRTKKISSKKIGEPGFKLPDPQPKLDDEHLAEEQEKMPRRQPLKNPSTISAKKPKIVIEMGAGPTTEKINKDSDNATVFKHYASKL